MTWPRPPTAPFPPRGTGGGEPVPCRTSSAHLDPLLAELVRIRVSRINGCAWCLSLHTRAALAAGESRTRLDELGSWRDGTLFTAAERAALPPPR